MNTRQKLLQVFDAVAENDHVLLDELFKSVNIKTSDLVKATGFSPLSYAAGFGYYQIAKKLLCAGIDADFIDDNCRTALMVAVQIGNLDMCRLLVRYGANVNVMGPSYTRTALGVAAFYGRIEIASFLLANGALPHEPMHQFETSPIGLACLYSIDVLKLLLKHSNKTIQKLALEMMFDRALKKQDEEYAIFVLNLGYYPQVKSDNYPQSSLVYKAAHYGCIKLIGIIMEINTQFLQEEWLAQKTFPRKLRQYPDLLSWLVEYRKQVPSLQKLCKSAIVSQLDFDKKSKINALPLPKRLQRYLCTLQSAYNYD